MVRRSRLGLAAVLFVFVAAGCAPGVPSAQNSSPVGTPPTATPKRLTAAIRGMPTIAYQKMNPRSNVVGVSSIERLVNTGVTVAAPDGKARLARLVEAAPTVENGGWKVLSDGGMETRLTLKPGLLWHDGTPMTTDDLVFSMQVWKDKDFPIFSHVALQTVSGVEVVDQRSVIVHWTQPYIHADQLFGSELVLPVSKHKLGDAYLSDRDHFLDHPGWGLEMVGNGPYKIKNWEVASFVTLAANDQYLLGRPKIDEIVVKFIPDPNTLAANVLAGDVDFGWGGRLDIEWAMNVANQWQGGKVDNRPNSMLQIFIQHINPTPAVVSNVTFKRAIIMALDRQQIVDTLRFGLTSIGHTFIAPDQPEYPYIESSIVKYPFDTRQSLQLFESLGYTKGADGALRDRNADQLHFQIRTSQGDVRQEGVMCAAADDWSRLGADVERFLVPPQRANDAQFRAEFPAFDVKGQAGTMDYATSFHSQGIALPENNYLASGNNSRYSRPEMDAAIDKFFTTVPWDQRMEYGKQLVRLLSDDVGWIGIYYDISPQLNPSRVLNVPAAAEAVQMDSVLDWDIK